MKNIKALVKNKCIDLGCMNGWKKEDWDFYKELKWQKKIEGSEDGRNLGRCYNESSFKIELDGEVVTVISTVDSSD